MVEAILDNAKSLSERTVAVDNNGNRKTTWKEFEALIYQIANYAAQLGLSGVIPVVQGRTMEYVATVLGLNLAGLAVSPLTKGYAIAYSDLFQHPSPRAIAAHVNEMKSSVAKSKTDDVLTQYDYSAIHTLLQKSDIHSVEDAIHRDPSIRYGKLGNVLLTGATGFLGMHILHEYLTRYTGTLTCLVRNNKRLSAESRLKSLLFFYFSNDYAEGYSPAERANKEVDLSPIDCTAEAVLKIADANLPVFVYHAYNDHPTRASELIEVFEECPISF